MKSKEQAARDALEDIKTFWETSNVEAKDFYRALYTEELLKAVLKHSKSELPTYIDFTLEKARASFKVELTTAEKSAMGAI